CQDCRGSLTTRSSSISTGILTMTPLRQRFIEDLQLRNRSPKTITAYVYHVRELARYFKQSPEQLGDDQIHRYLLHLLHHKQISWSSYNQAVAALRFFYRVTYPSDTVVTRLPYDKRPKRLPAVRSPQQVALFLDTVRDRIIQMVLRTIYATGLRISEALHLTAPQIDSSRMWCGCWARVRRNGWCHSPPDSWKNCVPSGMKRGRRNGCFRARIATSL